MLCPDCSKTLDPLNIVFREGRHFLQCTWCPARFLCNIHGELKAELADRKTRKARAQTHHWIDKLSRCDPTFPVLGHRRKIYRDLSSFLKKELKDTHVGNFNIEECHRSISILKEWYDNRCGL